MLIIDAKLGRIASGVLATALLAAAGCSQGGARATTIMTTEDYREIARTISQQLREQLVDEEGPFAERGPESSPWTVAVRSVRNLTSDQISMGTRWYLMDRVVNSDAVAALEREKNINFAVPRERLAGAGNGDPELSPPRRPTHVMDATFRSVTRIGEKQRVDAYLCQYEIYGMDGELVWNGQAEFKRFAHGLIFD